MEYKKIPECNIKVDLHYLIEQEENLTLGSSKSPDVPFTEMVTHLQNSKFSNEKLKEYQDNLPFYTVNPDDAQEKIYQIIYSHDFCKKDNLGNVFYFIIITIEQFHLNSIIVDIACLIIKVTKAEGKELFERVLSSGLQEIDSFFIAHIINTIVANIDADSEKANYYKILFNAIANENGVNELITIEVFLCITTLLENFYEYFETDYIINLLNSLLLRVQSLHILLTKLQKTTLYSNLLKNCEINDVLCITLCRLLVFIWKNGKMLDVTTSYINKHYARFVKLSQTSFDSLRLVIELYFEEKVLIQPQLIIDSFNTLTTKEKKKYISLFCNSILSNEEKIGQYNNIDTDVFFNFILFVFKDMDDRNIKKDIISVLILCQNHNIYRTSCNNKVLKYSYKHLAGDLDLINLVENLKTTLFSEINDD